MALWLQGVLIAVGAILFLSVLVAAVRSGKPIRRLFSSGLQGVGGLLLVNVTSMLSGVSLGFSWLSIGGCALLGIPGAILLVLMQIVLPIG